jgi:transposase
LSVRALARKYQVSRRTVRSALTSAWPAPRKPMPPRPSKLDPFKLVIDDILRVDLDADSGTCGSLSALSWLVMARGRPVG